MKKIFPVLVVLFISFELNAQWVQTNGPYGVNILSIAISGNNVLAGTDIGSVYLSTNDGTNWTQAYSDLTRPDVSFFSVSGNNVFAGLPSNFDGNPRPGGVLLSSNNGTNWTKVNNGLADSSYVSALAVSGTNIFAGFFFGGVFLSTNNGKNWKQINNGLSDSNVTALTASGTNIFAGTNDGMFFSTNNGTSWTQVNNGLTNTQIFSLAANGTNIFTGTSGGVFRSTNNGTSWALVNKGLTTNPVHSFAFSGTNIFVATYPGEVFLSINDGTNWKQVNNNLSDSNVTAIAVSGTNIFAGTRGAGVWSRPLSELTGVSNEIETLPQEYTLFRNYPNPFNPSTVIKYAIPFESNVNIRFYNSLGQTVREVNEGNRQPGNYEINFNSSGLASGIYFYSIKAVSTDGKNDFNAVKKMILLK